MLSLPVKTLRRLQRSRAVEFGDLLLPPSLLRLGGANFRDDEVFVESGRADAQNLRTAFEVDASSSILDIGCGVGRLPIGLLAEFGEFTGYTGVDVDATSIHWCRTHIEARHPGMRFVHLDVANPRYNRNGQPITDAFRLPWESDEFDAIFLYSVFSHMEKDDVCAYLKEFRRVLRPQGGVFLTAFVESGVSDVAVNPPDYGPLRWRGALHCVRYSDSFFERLAGESGLEIVAEDHGTETDGQSAIYLRRSSQQMPASR